MKDYVNGGVRRELDRDAHARYRAEAQNGPNEPPAWKIMTIDKIDQMRIAKKLPLRDLMAYYKTGDPGTIDQFYPNTKIINNYLGIPATEVNIKSLAADVSREYEYSTASGTGNATYTNSTTTTFKLHDSNYEAIRDAVRISDDTNDGYIKYKVNNSNWDLNATGYVTGYEYDTHTGTISLDVNNAYTTVRNIDYWPNPAYDPVSAKREELRLRLRRNLRPNINFRSRRDPVPSNVPENEQVAMETLREMITEQEFRKYLRYGFVLVPGKSGATYQVFRNRAHTKVWKNGKVVEEICVRISYSEQCPPTDNVIAFRAMIMADEKEFKKVGNVYRNMARAA